MQAYHLAVSGLSFAQVLLQQDDADADGPGDLWYQLTLLPTCFPPEQLIAMASAETDSLLNNVGLLAPAEERDADKEDAAAQEQSCVSLRIVDEERKLPINRLRPTLDDGEPEQTWFEIFQQFFELMQIDEDRLIALLDWIDSDSNPRPGLGAERGYYEGLESPYRPRNRPFKTMGELRLVRGFDADTLAKFFPGMEPEAMADVDVGTNAYLTALSTGEGGADQGARVNLNTANAEVLQALISGLQGGSSSADAVEQILVRREEEQFTNVSEVRELVPEADGLESVASVQSSFFRVESVGTVGPIRKRVVAILRRSGQNTEMVYFKVE
jgi:type II secretory pathway component PulK